MNRRLRVLHVGKYWAPHFGGIERFTEDLINAQRASGLEAFALVHGIPGQAAAPADDPPWLRRVRVYREVAFVPIAPAFLRALNDAIRDWRPDYIHWHMPNLAPVAGLLSRRARRLPWVVHWHSDVLASPHHRVLRWLYPFYRPYERVVLDRTALVIATSPQYIATSRSLEEYLDRCVAIALGLPGEKVLAASNRGVYCNDHWAVHTVRLLALGRLAYYKGFDTLIRAVAQVPEASLVIAGEGAGRVELERVISECGCSDRVRLIGVVSQTEKLALLREADAFCISSRERTEAFGLAALEAMHHALPLLASRLIGSGLNLLAREHHTALLAEVDHVESWVTRIRELVADPSLRLRLGTNAARLAREAFDIATVAERIEQVVTATIDPDHPLPEAHERPLVVIPARNEALTVAEVVGDVKAAGFRDVLVVDDASSDGTTEAARGAGAIVLRAPLPLGAWGAMQLGIRYGLRHNFTSVLTMDADGQHAAGELRRLLDLGPVADVVVGACTSRGSALRRVAWAWFRRITGIRLRDLTSGFRLYNYAAMLALAGREASLIDYQDVGVLLLLRRCGLTVTEVDVSMTARRVGKSRIFHSWWAVLRYMHETTLLAIARRGHVPRHRPVPGTA